jgi:DNA-binding HxlR family transcriptional regulator
MSNYELCPKFEAAMQLLGKRWMGLIISQLLLGPQRFGEMESSLPISGKLLSERLKELEKWGIVTRNVYPEIPVRIEYELTERGRDMEPIIKAIQYWAEHSMVHNIVIED